MGHFTAILNKAHGQIIPHVGLYLPNPVFSHGQLYVALSRAIVKSNLKILAAPGNNVSFNSTCTLIKNIVYKEILTL